MFDKKKTAITMIVGTLSLLTASTLCHDIFKKESFLVDSQRFAYDKSGKQVQLHTSNIIELDYPPRTLKVLDFKKGQLQYRQGIPPYDLFSESFQLDYDFFIRHGDYEGCFDIILQSFNQDNHLTRSVLSLGLHNFKDFNAELVIKHQDSENEWVYHQNVKFEDKGPREPYTLNLEWNKYTRKFYLNFEDASISAKEIQLTLENHEEQEEHEQERIEWGDVDNSLRELNQIQKFSDNERKIINDEYIIKKIQLEKRMKEAAMHKHYHNHDNSEQDKAKVPTYSPQKFDALTLDVDVHSQYVGFSNIHLFTKH